MNPNVIVSVGHKYGGGGQGTTAKGTFNYPASQGVIDKIFTWADDGTIYPTTTIEKCPYLFIPKTTYRIKKYIPLIKKSPLTIRWLLDDNVFDRWVASHIKKHKNPIDIFHGWHHQSLFSMRAAKQKGAMLVLEHLTAHPYIFMNELNANNYYFRPTLKKSILEFDEADLIIVPSAYVKGTFLESGVPSHKVKVIPYGVDIDKFKPSPENKDDTTLSVLFVGTVTERKGIDILVKGFLEANLNNCTLDIVGEVHSDMISLAARFKEHPQIRFHGHCNPLDFYQQASIFAFPSRIEGSALVCYEAAASGLPVIATYETGSVIRDQVDGYIIDKDNSTQLAQRLKSLVENKPLREEMSKNAREHILDYTWINRGIRVSNMYKMIVNSKLEEGKIIWQ